VTVAAQSAVARMTGVIENLIEAARLMDGRPELYFHPCEFDLTALLHDVCRSHRELTPKAQIIERLVPRPITIIGDTRRLLYLEALVSGQARSPRPPALAPGPGRIAKCKKTMAMGPEFREDPASISAEERERRRKLVGDKLVRRLPVKNDPHSCCGSVCRSWCNHPERAEIVTSANPSGPAQMGLRKFSLSRLHAARRSTCNRGVLYWVV